MASRIKIIMAVDVSSGEPPEDEMGGGVAPDRESSIQDLDQWRCMVGRCDCAEHSDHLI